MPFQAWARPLACALALRALARCINALTKDKAAAKNQQHALAFSPETPKAVLCDLKLSITQLEKRIACLATEAKTFIQAHPTLARPFTLLLTVKGIGETSAIALLGELMLLPAGLTHKQWVKCAGLDPRHFKSGSSVDKRARISKAGNRYLRQALYMPALSAKAHDPHVKGFFEHLIANGKTPMQGVCAVMRNCCTRSMACLPTISRSIVHGFMRCPHDAKNSGNIVDGEQSIYANRHKGRLAVLLIDLDNFKNVNDSLGHHAGDQLLQQLATRLVGSLREGDTVARLGGDEFVLILVNVASEEDASVVAQKILKLDTEPCTIDGHELFVTYSIGISFYPKDGEDAETLLKNADAALYRAKKQGGNNAQFCSAEMNAKALQRLTLENNLRNALKRQEFLLHYQARVDLHSGEITGMEALVRWQHPEQGLLIPPGQFIPVAEDSGLIVPLGAWVLHTACAQNKAWQAAGFKPVCIAVNLSARQFRQQDLVELVTRILQETGLDAAYLELELTESMIMQNVEAAIATLTRLKAIGVKFSIDDFGTGYSSLSYLKRFPIDSLKIDQSFVRDISTDPDDAAITKTIISMAHDLGLRVIAEGVETQEQETFLRLHHCDEIQGYFFSKPVPAKEFEVLLSKGQVK